MASNRTIYSIFLYLQMQYHIILCYKNLFCNENRLPVYQDFPRIMMQYNSDIINIPQVAFPDKFCTRQ